ncbi:unnamed protein product, partial [Linum tenue]
PTKRINNTVATSLDSQEFLSKNYKKATVNIAELRAIGCLVMHELDATKMAEHSWLEGTKFDHVIFNFPHAGFYPKESTDSQIRFEVTTTSTAIPAAPTNFEFGTLQPN